MQDRTIDSALIALAKRGGSQAKLADVLLEMRGVKWSGIVQLEPHKRGQTRGIILQALKDGPHTAGQLGDIMRRGRPDIGRTAATNRAYQALLRLEGRGKVCRDGRLWMLA